MQTCDADISINCLFSAQKIDRKIARASVNQIILENACAGKQQRYTGACYFRFGRSLDTADRRDTADGTFRARCFVELFWHRLVSRGACGFR